MDNPNIWRDVPHLLSQGNRLRKEERGRGVHKPRDPHQDRQFSQRTLKKPTPQGNQRGIFHGATPRRSPVR